MFGDARTETAPDRVSGIKAIARYWQWARGFTAGFSGIPVENAAPKTEKLLAALSSARVPCVNRELPINRDRKLMEFLAAHAGDGHCQSDFRSHILDSCARESAGGRSLSLKW